MVEIKQIDQAHAGDLALKNDPFPLWGRMIPALQDGVWSYRTEEFDQPSEQTFPDECYDFDVLSRDGAAFGAYEDGVCLGLAIYKKGFFDYWYLEDLKVSAAARRKGIGRALIRSGLDYAKAQGYLGVYLQAQDNNLSACLFYLSCGFEIGGFDNRVYDGTAQAGKADIYFYAKA